MAVGANDSTWQKGEFTLCLATGQTKSRLLRKAAAPTQLQSHAKVESLHLCTWMPNRNGNQPLPRSFLFSHRAFVRCRNAVESCPLQQEQPQASPTELWGSSMHWVFFWLGRQIPLQPERQMLMLHGHSIRTLILARVEFNCWLESFKHCQEMHLMF